MKMKNKMAISLIVLVITIIVLAILAATVIIALSNTNIIERSNNAVSKTTEQQIREAKELMKADGMANGNPASITIEDTTLIWDDESKTVIEKTTKDGTTKVDTVTIPSGFYYVGGLKDTGIVISDDASDENQGVDYICMGNQFVWVPVEDYSKFVRGTAVKSNTDSNVYKMTGELATYYTEPYINAEQWEKDEYNAMCKSVKKYQGFYIARFEAGDDVTTERTKVTAAHEVISKKNAYVYNYVPWGTSNESVGDSKTGGAVYLSQNMYSSSKSVVSTLCYGVQWDAIMNFVSDETHNIVDSSSWGKYSGSIQRCGENETMKAKNIYDLAGNVAEFTMEAFTTSARVQSVNRRGHLMYSLIETAHSREIYMAAKAPTSSGIGGRVVRGGNIYYTSYDEQQAVYRFEFDPVEVSEAIGFRVAMYII